MANGQPRLIDLIDDMCAGKDVFFQAVSVAGDLMTADVKTLTLDDSIETFLGFMRDNNVRHAPVMDVPSEEDEPPSFVGIVSERDAFRQISPYIGKLGEEETDSKALRQPLIQILTRNAKSVFPHTEMPVMIETMLDARIDMLPVLEDAKLVGIVTSTDIVKVFVRLHAIRQISIERKRGIRLLDMVKGGSGKAAAFVSSALQAAEEIMTPEPTCLGAQDDLGRAVQIMQKERLRHVPIVDKGKRLLGIVSDRNVLRHLPFRQNQRPQGGKFRGKLFQVDPKDKALRTLLCHVMTGDPRCVMPSCSGYDVANALYNKRISCVPVVDENKCLQGIVTMTDLMRVLLGAYEFAKIGA